MKTRGCGVAAVLTMVVLVIVVVVVLRAMTAVFVGGRTGASQQVVIPSGASVREIATELEEADVLKRPTLFLLYGRLTGAARSIQAGVFTLEPGLSIRALYGRLGNATGLQKRATLIEGWTATELQDYLVREGFGTEAEVEAAMQPGRWTEDYPFLSQVPAGLDIEGYVYPETYYVLASATADDVIDRALSEFETVVEGVDREVAITTRLGAEYSLFDVVTVASILEREVRGEEDMRMVADLIYRRLAIGMPLQMDSTVNYVTGKNDPGILLVDRDVESPYNTYKYPGLPVGPISNPSAVAIQAALNPEPNTYLFFLTDPEGAVHYAETNDQHVQNKNRYLR